jgi:hypothetical protein
VDIRTAEGLEVQVHHLISLGGWNDVIDLSICQLPARHVISKGKALHACHGLTCPTSLIERCLTVRSS